MKPYEIKGLKTPKTKSLFPQQKLPKPKRTVQEEVNQFRNRKGRRNGNGRRYYAKRIREIRRDSIY
jgi:hypothetical protein